MADKPICEAPAGMEPYDLGGTGDLGALSSAQQEKLNKFKMKTRLENEGYLRDHPEVDCIVSGFLCEVLTQRPENIRNFAAEYFTKPTLPAELQQMLEGRQQQIRLNKVIKKS